MHNPSPRGITRDARGSKWWTSWYSAFLCSSDTDLAAAHALKFIHSLGTVDWYERGRERINKCSKNSLGYYNSIYSIWNSGYPWTLITLVSIFMYFAIMSTPFIECLGIWKFSEMTAYIYTLYLEFYCFCVFPVVGWSLI